MYQKSLQLNKNILSDYEQVNLTDVGNSYNAFLIRKYLLSHPTQANIKDGQTILDLGSGTALVGIYICKQFPNIKYTCVVNSQQLFAVSNKNIKDNKLSNQIQVILLDFDKLVESQDIKDELIIDKINQIISQKYDRILLLESMGYSKDFSLLIDKCKCLLKQNGSVFIKTATLNPNCTLEQHKQLIDQWQYDFNTFSNVMYKLNKLNFKKIEYSRNNMNLMGFIYCNVFDGISMLKYLIRNNIDPASMYNPILNNICEGVIVRLSM